MKEQDIMRTVVRYMAAFPDRVGRADRVDHYMMEGENTREVVYGRPMDILADMIERDEFFGDWVPETVDQAENINNGRINRISPGDEVPAKVVYDGDRLTLDARVVEDKPYLAMIRTKEAFIIAAQMTTDTDIGGIANELYGG